MRGNAPQVVEALWAAKEEPPAKLVGFSFIWVEVRHANGWGLVRIRLRRFSLVPLLNFATIPSVSNRLSSSRAVEECQVTLPSRIATAPMSREIFLVDDYDGVFKDRVTLRVES